MNNCLFCDIASQKITTQILYHDKNVLAFPDINPQAPTHLLIIPREHISNTNQLQAKHHALIGQLLHTAAKLAITYQIDESGYRLVMNCGQDGGQTVNHIHLHLLGGRTMHWPPG